MNAAYREFLRDALSEWLDARGVGFDEVVGHLEEVLGDMPGAEPDPYRYAAADGTHIAVAFDRTSLETVLDPEDVAALERLGASDGVDYVDSVLAEWCLEFGDAYGSSGTQDIEIDALSAARARLGLSDPDLEQARARSAESDPQR